MEYRAIFTTDAALAAVAQNGYALRYVKEQTEAVCLAAVERDGDALRYVFDYDMFRKVAAHFSITVSN